MIPVQGAPEIWLVLTYAGTLDSVHLNEADAEKRVRNMKFSYSYQKYVAEGELKR